MASQPIVKYALFGANGAVGQVMAPLLSAQGASFRAVGRSSDNLRRHFGGLGSMVDLCAADLSNAEDAVSAAAGVDTLFYLVGAPYTHFELHPKLTRITLEAAARVGVKRFVQLGTVYPFGKPQHKLVDETHPRDPQTFKGRMRKEQEDLVLAADGRNGMRTLLLRAPDFYGPTSELSYVRSLFDAALGGGTANVIGPLDTPHEFIFVPDLATTLLRVAERNEAYGKAWNVAGPGMITTRRFAELVFAAVGGKPRLRVANKLVLRVMGVFNPFLREVAEMHYLFTSPVQLDDSRLRQMLPSLPKTSYEDGIAATINTLRVNSGAG